MAATVQGAYFFRNRVRSIPMYIGMSNDFYRPTKIASCAPGFINLESRFITDILPSDAARPRGGGGGGAIYQL